jgi:hypothetical protein
LCRIKQGFFEEKVEGKKFPQRWDIRKAKISLKKDLKNI